jgi:hypothetical protein
LPAGVTNVNRNGKNNSNHLIDRFWKISPAGYTINPQFKNLSFYYRDVEWNEDSNTITEKNLAAQNWNGTKWLARVGNDKPANNYVKIISTNVFPWWTLVDTAFALPLQTGVVAQANDKNDNLFDKQIINNPGIYLSQNLPNPFASTTTINYFLAKQFSSAKIIITGKNGSTLKQINVASNKGNIMVDASTLASGAYQYSLYVDGRLIDTKQMLISK